ncbi:hypothetical protein BJY59DRAFT_16789 [Rhodotorula toruloides]
MSWIATSQLRWLSLVPQTRRRASKLLDTTTSATSTSSTRIAAASGLAATLPGSRATSPQFRPATTFSPFPHEDKALSAFLYPPSSVCSGRTRWGVSARRSLWQTEDEAGGSQGAGQDVGVEEGCTGTRQTLQSHGSTPSFVSRQLGACATRSGRSPAPAHTWHLNERPTDPTKTPVFTNCQS